MAEPATFPYLVTNPSDDIAKLPYFPIELIYRGNGIQVTALLDTGSTVNVLPFDVGIALGAKWEDATRSMRLAGNLARHEAKVLIVNAQVSTFAPVRLAFAWSQSNEIPVILGQVNFLLEFDVCFFRSQSYFEITPKKA